MNDIKANFRRAYNRIAESEKIKQFIKNNYNRALLIHGDSGTGKSLIFQNTIFSKLCIQQNKIINYKFEYDTKFLNFYDYLRSIFTKKYNFLNKFSNINIISRIAPQSSPLIGIKISPPQSTQLRNYFTNKDFIDKLSVILDKDYDIFYIENIEKSDGFSEIDIIKYLISKCNKIKFVIEIGTLRGYERKKRILNHLKNHELKIKCIDISFNKFNERETKECYKFIHHQEAPKNIYNMSDGNAFAIQYFNTPFRNSPKLDELKESINLSSLSYNSKLIIFILTSLGGIVYSKLLQEISSLSIEKYNESLSNLMVGNEILYQHREVIKFIHPMFFYVFKAHDELLSLLGRDSVINYLLKNKRKKIEINEFRNDMLSSELLSTLYYEKNEYDKSIHYAIESSVYFYANNNFHKIWSFIDIFLDEKIEKVKSKNIIFLFLLQVSIRLGSINDAKIWFKKIDFNQLNSNYSLLLTAQFLYLDNKFLEAISFLQENASKFDSDDILYALGIKIASQIAAGIHNKGIENDFSIAYENALKKNNIELCLELLRLAPEVDRKEIWTDRFNHILKKNEKYISRYLYIYAKCMHNFGTDLILNTEGNIGEQYIAEAAQILKIRDVPEFSYCALIQAINLLLKGQVESAKELLQSSTVYCHELYDNFAYKENLGIIEALNGNFSKALEYFISADEVLFSKTNPLLDPHFRFQAKYNRGITLGFNNNFEESLNILNSITIPSNCNDYKFRCSRLKFIIESFKSNNKNIMVSDIPDIPTRWTSKKYLYEIVTLQFFDFNINVFPKNMIQLDCLLKL